MYTRSGHELRLFSQEKNRNPMLDKAQGLFVTVGIMAN
jgi:hypothetical protein